MQTQELIEHLEDRRKRVPLWKRWWMKLIIKTIKGVLEIKSEEAVDKVLDKVTRKR